MPVKDAKSSLKILVATAQLSVALATAWSQFRSPPKYGGSLFSSFRVSGLLGVFGVLGVFVFKTPGSVTLFQLARRRHLLGCGQKFSKTSLALACVASGRVTKSPAVQTVCDAGYSRPLFSQNRFQNFGTGAAEKKLLAFKISNHDFHEQNAVYHLSPILCKHRPRTHWTDKICLALPKFSTKFVFAKFSIFRAWPH